MDRFLTNLSLEHEKEIPKTVKFTNLQKNQINQKCREFWDDVFLTSCYLKIHTKSKSKVHLKIHLAKTQISAKYKTFRMGRNGPVM